MSYAAGQGLNAIDSCHSIGEDPYLKRNGSDHMDECPHTHLMIITERDKRLRCRFCHLTIKANELEHGYCPECFESSGLKRDDFEEVGPLGGGATLYRCEDCGVRLTPFNAQP